MRACRLLLVTTLLLGSAACGERPPLALLDAGGASPFVADGVLPVAATFACAGGPQLEVDGEAKQLDHMAGSVYYHEYRGEWLLHLDWCTSQYGGWGVFVGLSQAPRGKWIALGASAGPRPELHAFFGSGPGLPAGTTGLEAELTGTLLVDGDLPRLRVEVCLEATTVPTPYDRDQMVLRMYYAGRVGG